MSSASRCHLKQRQKLSPFWHGSMSAASDEKENVDMKRKGFGCRLSFRNKSDLRARFGIPKVLLRPLVEIEVSRRILFLFHFGVAQCLRSPLNPLPLLPLRQGGAFPQGAGEVAFLSLQRTVLHHHHHQLNISIGATVIAHLGGV